jgi:hypothetical protein
MPSSAAVKKAKRAPKKRGSGKVVKKSKPKKSASKLLVRTSERSNWKRCRWLWDQNYNKRLKPLQESPALRFGTLVHEALELRYPPGKRRGPHPARAFEEIYARNLKEAEEDWGTFADDEWTDALDLGVYMLEGYVEKYGKDEEWEVIASEMTFQVPVYLPKDDPNPLIAILFEAKLLTAAQVLGEEPLFYYVGTMDGVWKNRQDSGVRVIDYKTTKNDAEKEGKGKLKLDEQGTAYWTWGCDWLINEKILKPRGIEALDGMLYTFLRKAKRDDREQDAQGYYLNQPKKDGTQERSAKQPSPRYHRELIYRSESERDKARNRAINEVLEMIAVRAGLMEAYKNSETGANGHCGWCPQRDVCELHEAGADWEELRDLTMVLWDPYDAHEIKWAENR